MFTAFTYRLLTDQLRLDPTTGHVSSPLDAFPVSLTSGDPPAVNAPNTFPLTDGVELVLTIDGTPTSVVFDTLDFADITQATAAEVAAVLNAVAGISAVALVNQRVRITTDSTGTAATLQVSGDANSALVFPTAAVSGTVGTATLVLGHDRAGQVEQLGDGDHVTAQQNTTFDEGAFRLVGEVRVPAVPANSSWNLALLVDGVEAFAMPYAQEGTFSLDDFGFSAAQQAGAHVLAIRLRFDTTEVDPVDAELPAVYVDRIESVSQAEPLLINRSPYPGQARIDVSSSAIIELDVASMVNGVAVDQATFEVHVDGVLAYDGSTDTFLNGWDGGASSATFGTIYNAGATDARIVLESNGLSFDSEQVLEIRVVAQHAGGGSSIDQSYTFTTADTVDLAVVSAQARDLDVVRVTFNDSVSAAALQPSNYVFSTLTIPAATIAAVAVSQVDSNSVDIVVDFEMSQGAQYEVAVLNVLDDEGNPLDPDANSAQFAGFQCDVPDGRDFQLWDFVAGINRRRDDTDDLRKWVLILQDVTDLLLCLVDRWTSIIDVDAAPEQFVDAILSDLGNPFNFISLSLIDKRRLARILVSIYKTKGTEEGLVDAVRFLTGVDVTLDVMNANSLFWTIGVSTLGNDTYLAPPVGSPLWYSFWIDSPVVLTSEQRDQITKIATYFKAAHEHLLGIRDPSTTAPAASSYWLLGYDDLGTTTIVGN